MDKVQGGSWPSDLRFLSGALTACLDFISALVHTSYIAPVTSFVSYAAHTVPDLLSTLLHASPADLLTITLLLVITLLSLYILDLARRALLNLVWLGLKLLVGVLVVGVVVMVVVSGPKAVAQWAEAVWGILEREVGWDGGSWTAAEAARREWEKQVLGAGRVGAGGRGRW
jgi:Nuclear pore assembly and biogenesis